MINRFLVVLLISISFTSFGTNKLYILFNPDECTACSMGLKYLDSVQGLDKYFVFQEQYKGDSAQLIKQFYLSKYNCKFLFSDSLYQMTGKLGFSTVALVMDDGIHRFLMPLKQFNLFAAEKIKLLNSDYSTQQIKENRSGILNNVGFTTWTITGSINERVIAYDLFDKSSTVKIEQNDTALDQNYALFLGKPGMYTFHKRLLERLQVPKPYEFRSFAMYDDTVYVVSQCSYIDSVKIDNDTVVNGFYSIDIYNPAGKLIASHPITRQEIAGNYYVAPYIHKHNGILYVALYSENDTAPNRNFMGALKLNSNGIYTFDKVFPYTLPDEIYKNNHYMIPLFFKEYFVLPLEGAVRSLKDGRIIADPKPFNGVQNICTDIYIPPYGYITRFRYEHNFVWMMYRNNQTETEHFLKYDVLHKMVIKDVSWKKSEYDGFVICDFNYNYICYTKGDQLCFKRIFD